jgi:hypothetical protein
LYSSGELLSLNGLDSIYYFHKESKYPGIVHLERMCRLRICHQKQEIYVRETTSCHGNIVRAVRKSRDGDPTQIHHGHLPSPVKVV